MAPSLEAYVNKSSNKTALIKINVDHNYALAQKFGVRSIPSFVLYDASGKQTSTGAEARHWVNKNILKSR